MPIYEYRCQECRKIFEALVSSCRLRDQTRCPVCNSEEVQRIISAGSYRIASSADSSPGGPLGGCSARGGFS